jgi:hypothetical protein
MSAKEKLARQKKAADQIAEIMLKSLEQFPEAEQEARIRRIEKTKIRRTPVGKSSKPVSIRQSRRVSRRRASG